MASARTDAERAVRLTQLRVALGLGDRAAAKLGDYFGHAVPAGWAVQLRLLREALASARDAAVALAPPSGNGRVIDLGVRVRAPKGDANG